MSNLTERLYYGGFMLFWVPIFSYIIKSIVTIIQLKQIWLSVGLIFIDLLVLVMMGLRCYIFYLKSSDFRKWIYFDIILSNIYTGICIWIYNFSSGDIFFIENIPTFFFVFAIGLSYSVCISYLLYPNKNITILVPIIVLSILITFISNVSFMYILNNNSDKLIYSMSQIKLIPYNDINIYPLGNLMVNRCKPILYTLHPTNIPQGISFNNYTGVLYGTYNRTLPWIEYYNITLTCSHIIKVKSDPILLSTHDISNEYNTITPTSYNKSIGIFCFIYIITMACFIVKYSYKKYYRREEYARLLPTHSRYNTI